MVGGSAASSVHGWPRFTRDGDLVIRLPREDVDSLVEELQSDFYIDSEQIRTAIDRRRSFNLIHLQTGFKFDLFPVTADPYDRVQFSRRRFQETKAFSPEPLEFSVASPEDVILSKLRWYRLGGETSEKQWNDVLGVIAVNRESLEMAYLHEWASYLKIEDLLDRILAERHEPLR